MKKLIIFILTIICFLPSMSQAKVLQSYQINKILKDQGHFIRFIGDKVYTTLSKEDVKTIINKVMAKKVIFLIQIF